MSGPFELQLRAFAEKAKSNADLVVRKCVLDVGAELISRSPVATGRFRSNWFYALDRSYTGVTQDTGVDGVRDLGSMPGKAIGHVHTITNNVPYALRLEDGYSKQAPNGMVGLTVQRWQSIVSAAAAEVRAQ